MKNKLVHLNNHLFAQIERLSDEDVKGDSLKEEIDRAKAVGGIAGKIIDNAKLALDAHKAMGETVRRLPEMIGDYRDGQETV